MTADTILVAVILFVLTIFAAAEVYARWSWKRERAKAMERQAAGRRSHVPPRPFHPPAPAPAHRAQVPPRESPPSPTPAPVDDTPMLLHLHRPWPAERESAVHALVSDPPPDTYAPAPTWSEPEICRASDYSSTESSSTDTSSDSSSTSSGGSD